MSTRTAICWLLASLFAASSGCRSLDRSGTFSSLDRRPKGRPSQPTFATEDLPRFRSPDQPATADSGRSDERPAERADAPAEPDAPADPSSGQQTFDATTMALIDSELRDADPEDRAEWMEYLRSVDPEVIPHLLRARRLELKQRGERNSQSSSSAVAASNAPVAAPAPDDIEPITGKSPWDREKRDPRVTLASAEPFGDESVENAMLLQDEPEPAEGDSAEREAVPPWARETDAEPSEADVELFRQVSSGQRRPGALSDAELPGEPERDPLVERFSQIVEKRREKPVGERPITEVTETLAVTSDADPFEELSPSRLRPATKFSEDELLRLVSLLEAETAQLEPGTTESERNRYVRSHVQLRLLYWMTGQPDLALQAIPGLEASEQTYWTNMIWALSDYFDTQQTPDRAARMSLVLDRLLEAIGAIEADAQLQLVNTTFCRKIDGFGRVTRFDRDEFRAGQPVLVYAELMRFGSELTEDGQYRTQIGSVIEIFRKGEREPVHRIEMDPTVDLCGTRRRDYFHSYWIDLPAHLQAGPHELRLRVVDELTGQQAAASLPFRIAD